ncbi:RxLR effector protein [Phytophthora megakarya]|uniref:RxLR effector protein n=1 Tax=Phytophthora megakarya TaxID=4795 RepID=A0A225W7J4_9STRA|nr:RxLR effector protein [Phytophthora megakarya]
MTTDSRTEANSPSLHDAGVTKKNLKLRMLTTTDENLASSDERGLNFGNSYYTKLKELSASTTQTLEKFAAGAKLKMTSNKQTLTNKLFTKFTVDKVESNLLESAQFQKWFTSTNKAYQNNEEECNLAIVTTLTTHYGDEGLAKLLNEAKAVSNTNLYPKGEFTANNIAGKLKETQIKKWNTDGRSSSDVFYLLKLDKAGQNVFNSPVYSSFLRYSLTFDKNSKFMYRSSSFIVSGVRVSCCIAAKVHLYDSYNMIRVTRLFSGNDLNFEYLSLTPE